MVEYDHDNFGRVSIVRGGGILETYTYLGLGTAVGKDRPEANLTWARGVDQFGRSSNETWKVGGTVVDGFSYQYDRSSNILQKQSLVPNAPAMASEIRAYDKLGRVSHFTRQGEAGTHDNKRIVNYEFDLAGDPRWKSGWTLDLQSTFVTDGNLVREGSPHIVERFSNGSSPNSHSSKFDAWGRLADDKLSRKPLAGAWEQHEHRTYEYDALGRRIEAYNGATPSNEYFHGVDGNILYEEGPAHSIEYVWSPADGTLILADYLDEPTQRSYVLTDAEGSTTALTNASGVIQKRFIYSPYGDVAKLTGAWADAGATPSTMFSILHKGQLYDAWAQLYHNGSGDFDPVGERAIVNDPALLASYRNAYDPGRVTSDGAIWGVTQTASIAVIGGALMFTPLAPLVILAGAGFLMYQGAVGYSEYGGVGGVAAKVSGVADIYEGWTDTHWRTGAELGLTNSQRGALVSGGALQLGTMVYGIAKAPRAFGYEWNISWTGRQPDGSFIFGMNRLLRPAVRRQAMRRQMISDDIADLDGPDLEFYYGQRQSSLRRPKLRRSTIEAIEQQAPRTRDGKPIDPNTFEPLRGAYHYGHKPNHEHWRLVLEAEAKGMNQREFNDWVNRHPEWFQIEGPQNNVSHKYERRRL